MFYETIREVSPPFGEEPPWTKPGLKTGPGSLRGHGKSPFMTLDRIANASERTASYKYGYKES